MYILRDSFSWEILLQEGNVKLQKVQLLFAGFHKNTDLTFISILYPSRNEKAKQPAKNTEGQDVHDEHQNLKFS